MLREWKIAALPSRFSSRALGTDLLIPTLQVGKFSRMLLVFLSVLAYGVAWCTYRAPSYPAWLIGIASNPVVWAILFISILTIAVGFPVLRAYFATRYLMAGAKEQVVGNQYRNEVVVLDGKQFVKCAFENVTFKFNGTAPSAMIDCLRTRTSRFSTDNPAILNWTELLLSMKAFMPTIQLRKQT